MKPILKKIAVACTSATLLACAGTGEHRTPVPVAQAPGESVSELNRRATDLAEQGDYTHAIEIWRELTARAQGPQSAYLYRNLGYALFLNHEYDGALAALEKACLLDPLNARGWQHLGAALKKLGQDDRAQMMYRQAEALQQHDFRSDYAMANGTTVHAIAAAVEAPARAEKELVPVRTLDASEGIVDLRMPAQEKPEPPAVAPKMTLLEISNGNGVRGMAAATARNLHEEALRVVRLSNQRPFNVEHTRVEYEAGFEDAASRLAERFGKATMVKVAQCKSSDVRLVIGKDLVRAEHQQQAARTVKNRA